jgi:hypothetical protein
MRASSFRFPLSFPPQEKHFFRFLGKLPQSYFSLIFAHESIAKQFIVLFRGLKDCCTDLSPRELLPMAQSGFAHSRATANRYIDPAHGSCGTAALGGEFSRYKARLLPVRKR